jgi:HAD superfamily hydrolase (TIGR01484 family)
MRPLVELKAADAARVRLVLTDIDDTLTHEGRLPADAYRALEQLTQSGLAVAPITGRPAGWCDMIARFWPVAGVVGENGAFYFAYDAPSRKMRRAFAASEAERAENRGRLERVRERVLAEVPGSGVSADQAYREADLAIDFCEDVAALPRRAVRRIQEIFEEEGATAKISSIHVNGWYGAYDKLSMTRRFAREILGLDIDAERDRAVFVGDSPNDEPMFAFFPLACGVSSVRAFADEIEAPPAYVTEGAGGSGFVEVAERLIAARRTASL